MYSKPRKNTKTNRSPDDSAAERAQPERRKGSLLSLTIALSALIVSALSLMLSYLDFQKANPQANGTSVQHYVAWEMRYDDGSPAPPAPGTLLAVFQISNKGRHPTSIVNVSAKDASRAVKFRQVDGLERSATNWNDPILIPGGSAVTVAAYVHITDESCHPDDLSGCPSLSIYTTNDSSETGIELQRLASLEECEENSERTASCSSVFVIAKEIVKKLEISAPFCREQVALADAQIAADDHSHEAVTPEGVDEICALRTLEY